jgi:hypothetical protein
MLVNVTARMRLDVVRTLALGICGVTTTATT